MYLRAWNVVSDTLRFAAASRERGKARLNHRYQEWYHVGRWSRCARKAK